MTTATQPTWLEKLEQWIDELRRLDLKIDNDTRLVPTPSDSPDQLDATLISRTRLISHGELIADFEYNGRIRFRSRWDEAPADDATMPVINPPFTVCRRQPGFEPGV